MKRISSASYRIPFVQSKTPSIWVSSDMDPRLIDFHPTVTAERAKLFALKTKYLSPADLNYKLPDGNIPEFAFIGRSNVGKSSLIKAMISSDIVHVSKEPGCTRSVNFYAFYKNINGHELYFVDLPGYGFAKASKTDRKEWKKVTEGYFLARNQSVARRVFILVDSRHGLKTSDEEMMSYLDSVHLPYQIILTKSDLSSESEKKIALASVFNGILGRKRRCCQPEVHIVSSRTNEGLLSLSLSITAISMEKWVQSPGALGWGIPPPTGGMQ